MDVQKMVRSFHEKYGQPVGDGTVATWLRDCSKEAVDTLWRARDRQARMIQEEANEAHRALWFGLDDEVMKELADLVYVCYGAAVVLGYDLDPVIGAVHGSNMTKDGGPNGYGKITKGPGYKAPDIETVLAKQRARKSKPLSFSNGAPDEDGEVSG